MFLKSLTLKGFKSFAETTTLELEPGVTVVVGPNGSGKSNIVDAVAWVLGAQGPRTMRSTKMSGKRVRRPSIRNPRGSNDASGSPSACGASTRPASPLRIRARHAHGQPHGVAVLAVAHELRRGGRLATQRTAQLAHEPATASLVQVHALACQGRASAVDALLAGFREHPDDAAHELALKLVRLGDCNGHLRFQFATRGPTPPGLCNNSNVCLQGVFAGLAGGKTQFAT